MDDCIFCKIVAGEIPCYKIYEDKFTLAFLDISNDCNGHTLVIPKKHCRNILDCPQDTLDRIMDTVKRISLHYVNNCGMDGINILNANEVCAEQSVFHLHFHVLPRLKNDNNNTFPKLNKNIESLEVIANKLKIN